MPDVKMQYRFSSKPWKYGGQNGWVFISLPEKVSNEIRAVFKSAESGWGRLNLTAMIGNTEWKTAIWFDTKANTYLLPLKSEIRKKEKVEVGKKISIAVFI